MKNKGIVLSEVLCYVIVFSFVFMIIFTYSMYIIDFKKSSFEKFVTQSIEVQNLLYSIEDQLLMRQEDLYVDKEEDEIKLKGKITGDIYLIYKSDVLISETLKKECDTSALNLECELDENHIVLRNYNKKLIYIFKLESL